MKTTAVLLTALISGSAFGACKDAAWLDAPEVPDGQEATFEQMAEVREDVAAYVNHGVAYINCVEPSPMAHNFMVERLERVADKFNRERARFLEKESAVASN